MSDGIPIVHLTLNVNSQGHSTIVHLTLFCILNNLFIPVKAEDFEKYSRNLIGHAAGFWKLKQWYKNFCNVNSESGVDFIIIGSKQRFTQYKKLLLWIKRKETYCCQKKNTNIILRSWWMWQGHYPIRTIRCVSGESNWNWFLPMLVL